MNGDFTNRCRLCAEFCDLEKDYLFNNENKVYQQLISNYMSIEIGFYDTLPKKVCQICRSIVKSFDDFVSKCVDTQDKLKAIQVGFQVGDVIKIEPYVKDEPRENFIGEDNAADGGKKIEDDTIEVTSDIEYLEEDYISLEAYIRNQNKEKEKTKAKKKSAEKKSVDEEKKEEEVNDVDSKKKKKKMCNTKIEKLPSDTVDSNPFFNFICHVCETDCKTFSNLQKHVSSVHSETAYVTCSCSKHLRHVSTLYKHLMKHVDGFGMKCPVCTKKFRSKKFYDQHMKTHETEYKCGQCSKVFLSEKQLKNHEPVHIPKNERARVTCDICDVKLIDKYYLSLHKKTVHEKCKPFICDECGKHFMSAGAVKAHKFIHAEVATIPCPQCPKKFKSNARLKYHMDYHNAVTFKCPECSTLFRSKNALVTHFYTHRDIYKYVCGYCDKKFKWKAGFKSHINNHTGATPYKCDWCPRTFACNSNCRIHKKRKHPVELAESDARRAAENPIPKRSEIPIIKNIKLKEPTLEDVRVFPNVKNSNLHLSKEDEENLGH